MKRINGHRAGGKGVTMKVALFCLLAVPVATSHAQGSAIANDRDAISAAELTIAIERVESRLRSLVNEERLVDSLVFGWFDRPYSRVTISMLLKTKMMLSREVHLRGLGNGAITDTDVERMLRWMDEASQKLFVTQSGTNSRPHRVELKRSSGLIHQQNPPLFGIIDRSSATQCHSRYGDLDLLAALGLRIIAKDVDPYTTFESHVALRDRASDLGVTVVHLDNRGDSDIGASVPSEAVFVPMMLKQAIEKGHELSYADGTEMAMCDCSGGESWPASYARRALARGLSGDGLFAICNWSPPIPCDEPRAASTAMWIHAIEGQAVGLVAGWRDLRDGSGSNVPCALLRPAMLEGIARTAVDLLSHGASVRKLRARPSIALRIGADAVHPADDNRWSDSSVRLFSMLLERQIAFDLVPDDMPTSEVSARYRLVYQVTGQHTADLAAIAAQYDRLDTGERILAYNSDGRLASGVWVRGKIESGSDSIVAVANLTGQSRAVQIPALQDLRPLADALTGVQITDSPLSLDLEPWEIRLLSPAN